MLARLRAVFALGLLALGLPLFAQLDPRLQVKTPDFLDLFTGGSSSGGGAQIFFLLEASGSMNRLMFHRGFPNEIQQDAKGIDQSDEELPKESDAYSKRKEQSRYVSLALRVGSTGLKFVRLVDGYTGNWPNTSDFEGITGAITISGQTYQFGGKPVDASGQEVAYDKAAGNILVRPDPANLASGGVRVEVADVLGHPVDKDNLEGSENGVSDARNWIRSSTHIRLACWKVVGKKRDETSVRFVDLPLNWTVFDWAPDGGGFRTWNGKGLPPRKAVGSVEVDGTYPGSPWGTGKELNAPMRTLYNPWLCPRWSYHENKTLELVHFGATLRTESGVESNTPWIGVYRTRYLEWIFWGKDDAGNYLIPDAVKSGVYRDPDRFFSNTIQGTRACFANGLPYHSRLQAMKEAMLNVFQDHASKHRIGYRFLGGTDHDYSSNAAFGKNSPSLGGVGPIVVSKQNMDVEYYGLAKGGGDKQDHMTFLSRVGAYNDAKDQGHTLRPLHRAYYSSLMQYQNLLFGEKVDTKCGGRYLVVLGTGNFNDSKEYKPTETPGSLVFLEKGIAEGNKHFEIGNNLKKVAYGGGASDALGIGSGQYWNMPNLAGLAAHGGKSKELVRVLQSGDSLKDGGYLRYLPFQGQTAAGGPAGQTAETAATWFKTDTLAPIHTMTVGLGLAQVYDVPDNLRGEFPRRWGVKPIGMGSQQAVGTPKWRMMATAACGNPRSSSAVLTDSTKSYDPADPNSIHYFDGADPAGLVQAFKDLMDSIGVLTGKGSVAAPTLPVAGMGLGHQMYLTKFEIPEGNGTTWKGDLMMFPTREEAGRTVMLDLSGATPAPLSGPAEPEKAQWAASKILQARAWKDRKVFTRLPNATSWMQLEVDKATLQVKDSTFALLKGIVGTGTISKSEGDGTTQLSALTTDAAKKDALLWVLGKGAGTSNRDNLMGDVINSTPAVAEYNIDSVKASLPDTLATALNAATGKNPRFRVIFVGTNQGQLHAFGEISWEEPYTTTLQNDPNDASKGSREVTRKLVKGIADELWSFVPTDFLTRLHYLTDQKQALPHRYLVDGTALVYHLDLPASGSRAGNGKIDADRLSERARLVFGLGRGGRSYYALDIKDPMSPSLAWAHLADESGNARIQRLGATTATPTVGRVQVGKVLKDAVFLGGGYSHERVDAAFNLGVLGRSVVAVDVNDGTVLKGFSLPDDAGPVVAQVVPLDFYMNSGLIQRVYAADHKGSIWALGANARQTLDPYKDWRLDDSTLDNWSDVPRKVFDGSGAGAPGKASERMIGTAPSVFSISSFFPVAKMKVSGKDVVRTPATVGITFTTGDRFNPKDSDFALSAKPDQNHLHVIFDRNDVWDAITPKDLYTPTTIPTSYWATKTPEAFYQEYKGYRLKLNSRGSANFAPKGLVEPLVLAGTLFFSDFRELSSGTGTEGGCGSLNAESMTARVCDVLRPVFPGMEAQAGAEKVMGCASGRIALWYGVASRLAAKGVVSGLQAGLDKPQDQAGKPTPAGDLGVKTLEGNIKERFARPRVWRTVQDGI